MNQSGCHLRTPPPGGRLPARALQPVLPIFLQGVLQMRHFIALQQVAIRKLAY